MKARFNTILRWLRLNRVFAVYMISGWLAILSLSAVWSIGYFSQRWGAIRFGELLFFPCAAVMILCLVLLVKDQEDGSCILQQVPEKVSEWILSLQDWTRRRSFLVLTALSVIFTGFMIMFWSMLSDFNRHLFILQLIATVIYGSLGLLVLLLYCSYISYCIRTGTFKKHLLVCRLLAKDTDAGLEKAAAVQSSTARKGRIVFWVIYAVVFLLQFMVLASVTTDDVFPLFLLYKVCEFILVFIFLRHLDRLADDMAKTADGETAHENSRQVFPVLKQASLDLARIRDSVQAAVEKQLKSEHLKTELITNVSHDLKTPLTSVINYVDLLKKEELHNEKADEYIEVLSRQSDRLRRLTEDLIEASKASTGNLDVRLEPCDLSVMLEQAAGEFRDRLTAARLELIMNTGEDTSGSGTGSGIQVLADGRHLWRVFDNLLSNICKYAMKGSRVYIDVTEEEHKVRAIFRNISADPLNISPELLMKRFVRGDESRSAGSPSGNGLGLSIADSLMKLMNGELDLTIDGDLFKAEVIMQKPAA